MKYRTIVADPPWRYRVTEVTSNGGRGSDRKTRAAEQNYPTMSNREIAALPVVELAERDAHLYLWITNPLLFGDTDGPSPESIINDWGFEYVTLLTWHKLGAPGMGFYFRGDTEHVIFAVARRKAIPAHLRVSNHFAAPRTGHSAKPDRFYEIVERVSPEPRLELFARRRRVGWDVWGNEAPPESEARTQTHLDLTA